MKGSNPKVSIFDTPFNRCGDSTVEVGISSGKKKRIKFETIAEEFRASPDLLSAPFSTIRQALKAQKDQLHLPEPIWVNLT